jgi:hypothetical protein
MLRGRFPASPLGSSSRIFRASSPPCRLARAPYCHVHDHPCTVRTPRGDEDARQAHLSGRVAAGLMEKAPELLTGAPTIERIDVLAGKVDVAARQPQAH